MANPKKKKNKPKRTLDDVWGNLQNLATQLTGTQQLAQNANRLQAQSLAESVAEPPAIGGKEIAIAIGLAALVWFLAKR